MPTFDPPESQGNFQIPVLRRVTVLELASGGYVVGAKPVKTLSQLWAELQVQLGHVPKQREPKK